MIVTICYFIKSIKSVLILPVVPCLHITVQKLRCSFILYYSLNLRKKRWFVCALWLFVHIKSVAELGFFHEFAVDNKALKTFV